MPLVLAVRNGPAQAGASPQPLRLERGEVIVGRGAGAHLLLAGASVSRRHCTISGEGQAWRLVDSSTGGTWVNGQRLAAAHPLRHGDVIRIGEIEIVAMFEPASPGGDAAREAWGRPPASSHPEGLSGATQVPAGWAGQAASPTGGATPGPVSGAMPGSMPASMPPAADAAAGAALLQGAGGALLRASLSGLVRLAQDRRKAREELGVAAPQECTELSASGSVEELATRLMALPPTEAATSIAALCADIDAHQRAVMGAMQDCLHHALDQFSPRAIKTNARSDAEAWKAYEQAFEARDGFVEVFAQALARHYGEATGRR